jgi:hypothetical protein
LTAINAVDMPANLAGYHTAFYNKFTANKSLNTRAPEAVF